jgi:hypothetical protein
MTKIYSICYNKLSNKKLFLSGKQVLDKIGKSTKLGNKETGIVNTDLRLMDALPLFFATLKKKGLTRSHFLGFLHVIVGRRITQVDGTLVSSGMTWRDLANWLKKVRWEPEAVRELNQDPDNLPPRDRQRFWFTALTQAGLDSAAASRAGDRFAEILRAHGYEVGSSPSVAGPARSKEIEQDAPAPEKGVT